MSFSVVVEHIPQILEVASYIIAAAAVIATVTPTPKDNSVIAKIKKVLDFLAMNFGKAENKI